MDPDPKIGKMLNPLETHADPKHWYPYIDLTLMQQSAEKTY
jgi:hypothetical protein